MPEFRVHYELSTSGVHDTETVQARDPESATAQVRAIHRGTPIIVHKVKNCSKGKTNA